MSKMRVLIIEDDPHISRSIELSLRQQKLDHDTSSFGEEGINRANKAKYDLIILDLVLPDMLGHDVLHQLRDAGNDTPVLIVSGRDDIREILRGFQFGADDYVVKPFNHKELVARIHAVTRRSIHQSQSIIRTGKIEVNLDTKTATVAGKTINLTLQEYQILELMSLRKGKLQTKEMLLNHLYAGRDEPVSNCTTALICKLRKKLLLFTDGEQPIETVYGSGYIMRDPRPSST